MRHQLVDVALAFGQPREPAAVDLRDEAGDDRRIERGPTVGVPRGGGEKVSYVEDPVLELGGG